MYTNHCHRVFTQLQLTNISNNRRHTCSDNSQSQVNRASRESQKREHPTTTGAHRMRYFVIMRTRVNVNCDSLLTKIPPSLVGEPN
jgi:hypothetical protein